LKREYHSIRQTDTETSTEFMQHFLRLARFLGAAAGTAKEQAKNFQWATKTTLATTTGVLSRGPSKGYSYPVCTTCGHRHLGECRRAAGTFFKCGQTGHLQKDYKKNTTATAVTEEEQAKNFQWGLRRQAKWW
nr:zinc finger, CCHC-type, retrotransposon Gag domain protein [Tanacetum cinerariifolium]